MIANAGNGRLVRLERFARSFTSMRAANVSQYGCVLPAACRQSEAAQERLENSRRAAERRAAAAEAEVVLIRCNIYYDTTCYF
jgi:hypothetical protein